MAQKTDLIHNFHDYSLSFGMMHPISGHAPQRRGAAARPPENIVQQEEWDTLTNKKQSKGKGSAEEKHHQGDITAHLLTCNPNPTTTIDDQDIDRTLSALAASSGGADADEETVESAYDGRLHLSFAVVTPSSSPSPSPTPRSTSASAQEAGGEKAAAAAAAAPRRKDSVIQRPCEREEKGSGEGKGEYDPFNYNRRFDVGGDVRSNLEDYHGKGEEEAERPLKQSESESESGKEDTGKERCSVSDAGADLLETNDYQRCKDTRDDEVAVRRSEKNAEDTSDALEEKVDADKVNDESNRNSQSFLFDATPTPQSLTPAGGGKKEKLKEKKLKEKKLKEKKLKEKKLKEKKLKKETTGRTTI
ncbi:hypothetical protein IWX90DRAFT_489249 [Phyllosticta citrichinensis]|uniref:Uncharacterized protein n=1 Tax=Phyllosticta citrichinensis TaxID=1130410 RepID=A0ABR1XM69_9PEZI